MIESVYRHLCGQSIEEKPRYSDERQNHPGD